MDNKRKVEIFSAGCGCCEETIRFVKSIACPSCDITVLDMKQRDIAERAKSLGVRSVPAVVINGELAGCCAGRGPDEQALRAAGLGAPL
jgi:glutaredoxin 3